MELKHYKDFFTVPATYRANMTREAINDTPETWMDFYPHATYIELLNTLFDESKSLWITGNFGTGKSNAALVTQKLFMDDAVRVEAWLEDKRDVIVNCDSLKRRLFEARQKGTLVIYDYNASGIAPHEEFLVRLEKGVLAALEEYGFSVPAKGNLETVIERLRREGENFFAIRNTMLSEMKSLKSDINSIEKLVSLLQEESSSHSDVPMHYLEDVQAVFHRDNIYLNIDVPTFRKWIQDVLKANNLHRIIYIFDEFSEFVDENSSQLKTFEDVTEAPDINHFYLVPVTHKEPVAFLGENAPGAKRARDRFYFRDLRMPNDIAFKLAGHAMKENEGMKQEWKNEKDKLWSSISTVVDRFDDPETSAAYVSRESFYNILPIHPMAAFLLKFLAEHARSNQRSIFEYLKGSADGREFQEFVAKGGPSISSAQFLTPDYLWKYFMERSDAGQSREITDIKLEYDRIVSREFRNYGDEQAEIRVLKTVMLFSLLSRLASDGHKRLLPTVENVELSFRGDGTIMDVRSILTELANENHCFSIVDGNIDLYSSTIGGKELEDKVKDCMGKFHELLHEKCEREFDAHTRNSRAGFSGNRFDIRVSDESHTTLANISPATRDKFSQNLAKDDGSICLWFIVAKEKSDQIRIHERVDHLLTQLRDHRIVMLSFPNNTFCKDNTNLWNEYATLRAQYLLENNTTARDQIKDSFEGIENKWIRTLKAANTAIEVCFYDADSNSVKCESYTWALLKGFLKSYTQRKLDACPDVLTEQITVFGNKALKVWALAGLRFTGTGQQGQLVNFFKEKGVTPDDNWFETNPNHIFSNVRALLKKKYDNTVGKGTDFSMRKAWIDLKRAPFGMRYNCLSAFVLGFCSSWMISKNCQWTNKQLTLPLDEDTLAEIIESTVSEKTDKEKYICKLSKEDKAFAKNVTAMFGRSPEDDSTPLRTLEVVSSEVEASSMKVPLWILADYIRNEHPEHNKAADILDKLCIALKISSKGNNTEKAESITEIGRTILEDNEIVSIVALYTKSSTYIQAFQGYVDKVDPELRKLAETVEDQSHQYCDIILADTAQTSGWLWNKSDISSLVKKVHQRYQFMALARDFLRVTGYTPYNDIVNRLGDKIGDLGVPYAIIEGKYPPVARLIKELTGSRDAYQMLDSFIDSKDSLNALYNDPQKKLAVALIRERLGDVKIDDDGLAAIIVDVSNESEYSNNLTAEAYVKLIKKRIEKNERNLLFTRAQQEWKRITHTDSIDNWAEEIKIPAWTVFADADGKSDFIKLLSKPEDFSTDALKQQLSLLEIVSEVSIEQCQASFMRQIIPKRYKKLDIKLASLIKYLEQRFGSNPNEWPERPDISGFVKEQYQVEIAPSVVNQLKQKDANVLKKKILELAMNDPDIGLRLLEL